MRNQSQEAGTIEGATYFNALPKMQPVEQSVPVRQKITSTISVVLSVGISLLITTAIIIWSIRVIRNKA